MLGTLMYRRNESCSYPASAFVSRPVLEPLASPPHGEGVEGRYLHCSALLVFTTITRRLTGEAGLVCLIG
jgi:hypothetical protein